MKLSVPRRIYRVRALSSAILCLPACLFVFWYSWNAYERFSTERRVEGENVSLRLETFHILLHDLLVRDLRRVSLDPPPNPPQLEVFTFQIDSDNLRLLHEGAKKNSQREYASAQLQYKNQLKKVNVRLRGQRYWHLGTQQKSLKIRLPKGDLINGYRVFNLINDPSPMVVGEQLILDIAGERNVLTPRSSFARVRMNATDLGVFHYETQPDESLLRTNCRVPGSIYSGDLTSEGKSSALWKSAKRWKKPSSRIDDEKMKEDFSELERLLTRVRKGSFREFDDFVRHEMDLEAFATFDAVDVAFGGDRHNYRQNHKYAFDPYRGRFEPIAWSFEGFRDDPAFNLVEHPLLIRLKMNPGYLTLRDRLLYEFLTGDGAPAMLQQRGEAVMMSLAPDLKADPFWDAYRLLSRIDSYHRQMVRPMSLEKAALVFESELTTYRHRNEQLTRELEKNPLYVGLGASETYVPLDDESESQPGKSKHDRPAKLTRTHFTVVIDGRAGVSLEAVEAETNRWPWPLTGAS